MASKFKFGVGSGGGGSSNILSLGGAPTSGDNLTVFDLTTISTVNSRSQALAVLLSVVDPTEFDLGFWIGVRWQLSTARSYRVGTGNGGANISDKYTQFYTTWYTVIATGDNLNFEYEDVSTA